jgi:RNA polymerase sigma-70 factor (ECF subfamily)
LNGKGTLVALTDTTDTEISLIEQARNGDRNAYGELVSRHYQGVVRVVMRMCADPGLAEDAAQEAFTRAWLNLPSFEPRACLRNWLYRIAINAALDVLRRKVDEPLNDEQEQLVSDRTQDPETVLIEKEQAMHVQRALQSLPEAARAALVLREYGGLNYQEIAGVLEVPVGTVMSRLNYARNRLREILLVSHARLEKEYA